MEMHPLWQRISFVSIPSVLVSTGFFSIERKVFAWH
jgi:hypothetical protein